MNALGDTLKRVWFTSGHQDLWNCDSTYCAVPYHLLPKLDNISEDFSWLDDLPHESFDCTLDGDDNQLTNLHHLISAGREIGLEFPPEFIRFMANPSLQAKVPTCTACFLELSNALIPVPGIENTYVLRFMNDSQSCIMWYLLLQAGSPVRVLASSLFFEPDIFEACVDTEDPVKYEYVIKEATLCADTFLEFIYRFWIENAIWFSINDQRPLSPREVDYQKQITTKL